MAEKRRETLEAKETAETTETTEKTENAERNRTDLTKKPQTGSVVPQLLWRIAAAVLLALIGTLAMFAAFRAETRFDQMTPLSKSVFPYAFAGAFCLFVLFEGAAAGFVAAAFERAPTGFLPHISAPLVFAAALALSNAFFGSAAIPETIFGLAFYLSGFLLFRARIKGKSKTGCVLFAAVPGVILAAIVFALRAMDAYGASLSSVGEAIRALERKLAAGGESLAVLMLKAAGENGSSLMQRLFSPEELSAASAHEELLASFFSLTYTAYLKILPALCAAGMCVGGYAAAFVCNRAGKTRRREDWTLSVSGFGTLLFLASTFACTLFISLIYAGAAGVFFVSVRLIFLPVMLAMGVRTLFSFKKEQIRQHPVLFVLSIIFIVLRPITAISLIGAFGDSARRAKESIAQMRENGEPKDDPPKD